jgi:hypothetical protein
MMRDAATPHDDADFHFLLLSWLSPRSIPFSYHIMLMPRHYSDMRCAMLDDAIDDAMLLRLPPDYSFLHFHAI